MYIQKSHIPERKPEVYIDIEDTILDFAGSARKLGIPVAEFKKRPDISSRLMAVDGALDACNELDIECHLHLLIAPPEENPLFLEEFNWICKKTDLYKKVVLLPKGYREDYYIHADPHFVKPEDARRAIKFGSPGFTTWDEVLASMRPYVKIYL